MPGGSISGNNLIWRKFTFTAITTSKIRVMVTAAATDGVARIMEIEAWGNNIVATNVALSTNGATATAQNYTQDGVFGGSHFYPSYVIDGQRYGHLLPGGTDIDGFWRDEHGLPSWMEVNFNGSKTIEEIDVFTTPECPACLIQADPSSTQTFSQYGVTGFEVQYWTGSSWATVPGGSISGNNLIWRKFIFAAITTSKIRVMVTAAATDGVARIMEIEAWTSSPNNNATVNWLVSDHLGTPRIVVDQTGAYANVKRHDYLPFGEEHPAGIGGRSTPLGYEAGDGIRQQFTQKERDVEIGLDFSFARYYSSIQGRFTSPDPLDASGHAIAPQSWNRYSYVLNSPLNLTDPDGEIWVYHYLDEAHKRIGIAWIEGNKISKDLQAKGYQALDFGGEKSKDVTLNNGSVVRLSADSGRPEVLRGAQASGGGAYVNAGLVRELARQTAPIPKATGMFILGSIAGGYNIAMIGGPVVLADATIFSLATARNFARAEEEDAQMMGSTSSVYQEITKGGSIRNVQTDVTKDQFIKNLQAEGYQMSKSGSVTILDNGATRYVVYDVAKSTGGPSAAFSRLGEGQSLKIRLK